MHCTSIHGNENGRHFMPFPSIKSGLFAVTTAFALSLPVAAAAQAQKPGPFAALAGNWTGTGTIAMANGSKERIRCRSAYEVDASGTKVDLQLRCASDSYRFELQGSVVYQNGEILGNWKETTRGVAGNVTGSIKGNQIDVRAAGQTFTALLSLVTRADQQTISIRSPGSEMSEALITQNRGQ
jgi:3D (Asp-Asp-Asp) domain-containing protein